MNWKWVVVPPEGHGQAIVTTIPPEGNLVRAIQGFVGGPAEAAARLRTDVVVWSNADDPRFCATIGARRILGRVVITGEVKSATGGRELASLSDEDAEAIARLFNTTRDIGPSDISGVWRTSARRA